MRISDWSSDVCSSDLNLSRDVFGDSPAVLADQHQHGADHRLFAVHAARTGSEVAADFHIGELSDRDGHAAARRDDGVADFIDRTDARIDAHEIGLARPVIIVGPDRSEEQTSGLQSLMRNSYDVLC